jgi:hypothetical protein
VVQPSVISADRALRGANFANEALPVILKTCSACHDRQADPLTWTVWAWNRTDGVRVAYKQKLCVTCVATKVAPLYVTCESPDMTCPNCGIDTSEDMDAVFCTFIPRGLGKMQIEAPMCGACAVSLRVFAQQGAEFLEDRGIPSRGQETAPRYGSEETWAALGLRPRDA